MNTESDARQDFFGYYGHAAVSLRAWKIATAGVGALALAFAGLAYKAEAHAAAVKPLIVRIDQVGRAEVVSYDAAATWTPRPPELRYFLARFLTLHRSRVRATLRRDFPASLYFLTPRLATSTVQARPVETFLQDGNADEVEAVATNVSFGPDDLSQPPYRAEIDFDEVAYASGTRIEYARRRYTAHVSFIALPRVPNDFEPINPLGLQITQLRVDQAF